MLNQRRVYPRTRYFIIFKINIFGIKLNFSKYLENHKFMLRKIAITKIGAH